MNISYLIRQWYILYGTLTGTRENSCNFEAKSTGWFNIRDTKSNLPLSWLGGSLMTRFSIETVTKKHCLKTACNYWHLVVILTPDWFKWFL